MTLELFHHTMVLLFMILNFPVLLVLFHLSQAIIHLDGVFELFNQKSLVLRSKGLELMFLKLRLAETATKWLDYTLLTVASLRLRSAQLFLQGL